LSTAGKTGKRSEKLTKLQPQSDTEKKDKRRKSATVKKGVSRNSVQLTTPPVGSATPASELDGRYYNVINSVYMFNNPVAYKKSRNQWHN